MLKRYACLIFSCLLLVFQSAFGQITVHIKNPLPVNVQFANKVNDRAAVNQQANKIVQQLFAEGYLTAACDSIYFENDTATLDIYSGNIYKRGNISFKQLPRDMIQQFGFNVESGKPFNLENFKSAMSKTLGYFENQGYPFAYFYFDSLNVGGDTISGSLYFEKNILITFDTLAIYGDGGVGKKFLYNYLGFKPGDAFSEAVFQKINEKLVKLPFTTLNSKPMLYFVGRKAIVLLNLKKRKTDRLDGLIGFAPNTGTPGNTKLLVTGEFHLDFKNLKGTGTGFKADWQSFRARSQTLNATLNLPYLFNQPIGAELLADFLKYDTLYTETRFGLGLQYIYSGLDNIKIYYEQKNTNLQTVDTLGIRLNKKIADQTGMRTRRYGIAFNSVSFDNRINPRKGSEIDFNFSLLKREIQPDEKVKKVLFYDAVSSKYYTVYDSLKLKSYQFLFQYHFAQAINFKKNWVWFNELRGYHFLSPNIYFNELYRFGGNSTFKGFNEQSLYASSVSILNTEVRYLLSEYAFIRLFGNMAAYEDQSSRQGRISNDIPFGFGGGINLETGGGLFNISVALGKSKYNPIDFKNAKVHFGIINYF
jgi:hypothetical protein